MAVRKPKEIWSKGLIFCQSAMEFVDSPEVTYGDYGKRLQKKREIIIEEMMDMIMNPGYFKPQPDIGKDLLYLKDAARMLAKFVQNLKTVFPLDKVPAVGVATSAAANAPLYDDCQRAMMLLESNSVITSEKFRKGLKNWRDAIIENMMKVIMSTVNSKMQCHPTGYLLSPKYAPEVLVMFLQHLETVFKGDEEVRLAPKKQQAMPATASLVTLVKKPDPRRKSGILRTYGEMNFFYVSIEDQLEFLQGRRILNEEWSDKGETCNLTGEKKTMLCMHLWSLMRYAGYSKPDKIWADISEGWPECVSWENKCYGHFWKVIYSEEVPLRLQAEIKGLKTILDAYKDMERYFKLEGDNQHCLINWPNAYYPTQENPNPSEWAAKLRKLTERINQKKGNTIQF